MACSETITMASRQSLDKSIDLLSSVDAADAPFLSCYLDLEADAETWRFIRVIASMLPFRHQLTFYRVPDVRPLLSLRDAYGEHFLLWAASDGVELLRLEGGRAQTLA